MTVLTFVLMSTVLLTVVIFLFLKANAVIANDTAVNTVVVTNVILMKINLDDRVFCGIDQIVVEGFATKGVKRGRKERTKDMIRRRKRRWRELRDRCSILYEGQRIMMLTTSSN